MSNHRTQQRDGSSKEIGPRRKAGNPLRPSRSTAGAARPHLFLKQSLPRHAVLNRRPSAQKDQGKTHCAIGAAPEEMWHWIWLLRLIGRCTSFYRRLSEGAECRAPRGATRFAVLGPHPLAANVCRCQLQLLLLPRSCSAPGRHHHRGPLCEGRGLTHALTHTAPTDLTVAAALVRKAYSKRRLAPM